MSGTSPDPPHKYSGMGVSKEGWIRSGVYLGLLAVIGLYLGSAGGGRLSAGEYWAATWARVPAILVNNFSVSGLLLLTTLYYYLISVLILLSDFVVGLALIRLLMRRAVWQMPTALLAASAVALGSGLAGTLLFAAGALGQLTGRLVLGLTIATALAGVTVALPALGRRRVRTLLLVFPVSRRSRPVVAVVALLVLPVAALHVMDLLMPVLEFDSTLYHMSAVKYYKETASIAYQDGIRHNAQPQLSELLYLRQWLLVGDDGAAKLLNLEFGLILVLVLAYTAREVRWRDSWVLGTLFVASSPILAWMAKVEYADFALTAFATLGILLLYHQCRHPSFGLVPASALALGFAAACKYQGLVIAACAVSSLVAAALCAGCSTRWLLRACLTLVGFVTILGLPWWIRSWIHTGSPFAPFFATDGTYEEFVALFESLPAFGIGHGLRDLLSIAYDLATTSPMTYGDAHSFGLPLLILQPLGVLAIVKWRWAHRPAFSGVIFLGVTTGLFFLFWFYSAQVARYLACLLPVFAVLFLVSVKTLCGRVRLPTLLTLILAALAAHALYLTSSVRRFRFLPPVTAEHKHRVLTRSLPYLRATDELNRRQRSSERAYILLAENARYYLRWPNSGDWLGKYSYVWLAKHSPSPAAVIATLRQEKFDYLLVDRDRLPSAAVLFPDPAVLSAIGRLEGMDSGASLVYSDGRYAIIRIR